MISLCRSEVPPQLMLASIPKYAVPDDIKHFVKDRKKHPNAEFE